MLEPTDLRGILLATYRTVVLHAITKLSLRYNTNGGTRRSTPLLMKPPCLMVKTAKAGQKADRLPRRGV